MQNNYAITKTNQTAMQAKAYTWKYRVISEQRTHPDIGIYRAYGIQAFDVSNTHSLPEASVHDITSIQNEAEHLVEQLNRYQLSPTHLEDYISDYLAKTF